MLYGQFPSQLAFHQTRNPFFETEIKITSIIYDRKTIAIIKDLKTQWFLNAYKQL